MIVSLDYAACNAASFCGAEAAQTAYKAMVRRVLTDMGLYPVWGMDPALCTSINSSIMMRPILVQIPSYLWTCLFPFKLKALRRGADPLVDIITEYGSSLVLTEDGLRDVVKRMVADKLLSQEEIKAFAQIAKYSSAGLKRYLKYLVLPYFEG